VTDETMSLYAAGDLTLHGIDERRGVELLCREVLPRLRLA
jgi:hypothetical protein